MHVVATAGHVDHGKSTLVRALTGMEPDRWAEERRRGMTIDLGFAWTDLPGGGTLAFVDVPGHERFVPTMLAGVGPVPAVLLVVAADEGWMPQTTEHVAALDALGVRRGLLVLTRADLADPAAALRQAREHLTGTTLDGVPAVAVSAATGHGMPALLAALADLAAREPAPDLAAPVRLWIDRAFTVRGSGTVVTGTLPAGRISVGDTLTLHTACQPPRPVTVRGLQTLGTTAASVHAVARVAVNLRGVDRQDLARGDALATPGAGPPPTALVDARLDPPPDRLPATAVLHAGTASVAVALRPLGEGAVRVRLERPLPLHPGDVTLLRDPGAHRVLGRLTLLDTAPPPLQRRGAAAARARDLTRTPAGTAGPVDGAQLLRERGTVLRRELDAVGAHVPADAVQVGDRLVDPELARRLRERLTAAVAEHRAQAPLEPGPTVEDLRRLLGLPDVTLVAGLAAAPLSVRNGRMVDVTAAPPLPPAVADAVRALQQDLAEAPFAAPDAPRLAGLGLGARELAAAERSGALLRVADGLVLLPGADRRAAEVLAGLPQPFTLSQARQALGTTRRVAVPLLELLDRRRLTHRLPDDRRTVARS